MQTGQAVVEGKGMRWVIVMCAILATGIGFLIWQNLIVPKATGLNDGRLSVCPTSPNCVCCCHNNAVHYIAPLPLCCDLALDRIESFLSQNYITQIVQRTPDYLHVVVTTPFFRFKSDLEFAVNQKREVVMVRSASRVGYSDLGLNRSRIEALRAFLSQPPGN